MSQTDLIADDFTIPQLALPKEKDQHPSKNDRFPYSDQPKNIGNALSFFRRRSDPKESRYLSADSQNEGDATMPFSEEEMQSVDNASRNSDSGTHNSHSRNSRPDLSADAHHQRVPADGSAAAGDHLTDGVSDATHHFTGQGGAGANAADFGGAGGSNLAAEGSTKEALGRSGGNFLRKPATFFGRNSTPGDGLADTTAADDQKKPRGLFTLFRKKNRDRERRQGVVGDDGVELDSEDKETGERAQVLLNSLVLGAPAINLLASCLCEDEYGIARAPLLTNMIGIKVTDISHSVLTKNKKFRIDLEYGVSPQRLKWSVEKTAKDVLYLHSRFKWLALRGALKSDDLPRYPVPPLLRREKKQSRIRTQPQIQGQNQGQSRSSQSIHRNHGLHIQGSLPVPEFDQPPDNASLASGHSLHDRLSTLRAHFSAESLVSSLSTSSPEQMGRLILNNQQYVKEMEKYLCDLNLMVSMRPQSNRLFQFFEISPISSLLSYETDYIGKQGIIHVGGTASSQGWRVGHFKANDLKGMIDRRSEKWFLVRGSYVMYISDIISTTPLEVFLIDSGFKMSYKGDTSGKVDHRVSDLESDFEEDMDHRMDPGDAEALSKVQNKVFKHLRIILENSERKLVIIPKSRVEQKLWIASLNEMVKSNVWAGEHRFGSFAPIRKNVYAQWLVDARDYFWAISSALELAKDVIFIHDWWLSPELYLRRPANGNQQFRIDRILQRKAQQGVKIFVIVYRNVGTTIPIDSLYTKHLILSLNQENIHVIRSPNQLLQNTFFWAHHEKICIIDYNIGFLGGIDLCYGRYDTPDHVLADDSGVDFATLAPGEPSLDEFNNFRIFPGKDYSNTRVKDFSNLNKPYESLYDRSVVPRMPWHDIHMMTSGEVARDLARHFVQRWNYLLRQKRPSRLTPLLTPPSDMTPEMAKELNLNGTCEVQLLRSSGNWSLGLKQHEESIHQAYLKLIETSEHFIYIENQFFVTSCFIDGTEIQNRIGDAIVDRIIRAHKEGKNWKAIILIPLVPGFESQVDEVDGSSVRVVMQCQYMSISRGTSSLFAKLRKAGIDADDYIQFFSLRKWGILGKNRDLVTEQLYIHAKTMIVDDRVAIIGSANINERSMRGLRDSEVAAVIRDSDTIRSTMDGQPYRVGKFAHSLRLRLMREHLGVAVDLLDIVERKFEKILMFSRTDKGIKAATNSFEKKDDRVMSAAVEFATRHVLQEHKGTQRWRNFCQKMRIKEEVLPVPYDIRFEDYPTPASLPLSFNNRTGPHEANVGIRDKKKHSFDPRVQNSADHKRDVYGEGTDQFRGAKGKFARLNSAKFLRRLSRELMEVAPDKSFLPDIHNVKQFLESDDAEIFQRENGQEEVSARNNERWMLLKRIAYLQMVASRDAQQTEIERKKRVLAGLSPTIYDVNDKAAQNGNADQVKNSSAEKAPDSPKPVDSAVYGADGTFKDENLNVSAQVNVTNAGNEDSSESKGAKYELVPEKSAAEPVAEINAEQIPVVSVDDEGFKETIRKINLPGLDSFSKFVDPFSFDDPLDPDFYEDIWFDNARRNTDIFRLIFHCQPDDAVPTWKEYMHFMKLQKAFKVAQAEDASPRNTLLDSDVELQPEKERPNHRRRSSHATINISEYGNENGFFGSVPSGRYEHPQSIAEEPEHSGEDIGEPRDNAEDSEAKESTEDSDELTEGDSEKHKVFSKPKTNSSRKRKPGAFSSRRRVHVGDRIYERDSAQRILQEIHGHLVLFPVDWLHRELEAGNWFFNTDRLPPIEIYD